MNFRIFSRIFLAIPLLLCALDDAPAAVHTTRGQRRPPNTIRIVKTGESWRLARNPEEPSAPPAPVATWSLAPYRSRGPSKFVPTAVDVASIREQRRQYALANAAIQKKLREPIASHPDPAKARLKVLEEEVRNAGLWDQFLEKFAIEKILVTREQFIRSGEREMLNDPAQSAILSRRLGSRRDHEIHRLKIRLLTMYSVSIAMIALRGVQ